MRPGRAYRSRIPVEESVYPKFPRRRKEIFRVRDRVRSRKRDGEYFTPSRAAVSVYEVEVENSSCDSDKRASFAEVSRVGLGKPRAELRTAVRDLASVAVKRAI